MLFDGSGKKESIGVLIQREWWRREFICSITEIQSPLNLIDGFFFAESFSFRFIFIFCTYNSMIIPKTWAKIESSTALPIDMFGTRQKNNKHTHRTKWKKWYLKKTYEKSQSNCDFATKPKKNSNKQIQSEKYLLFCARTLQPLHPRHSFV